MLLFHTVKEVGQTDKPDQWNILEVDGTCFWVMMFAPDLGELKKVSVVVPKLHFKKDYP